MNMFMLISLILYNWTSFPIMWSILSALRHTFNQILTLVGSGSICLWFVMGLISIIDFLGNRMQSSNASNVLHDGEMVVTLVWEKLRISEKVYGNEEDRDGEWLYTEAQRVSILTEHDI